MNHADTEHYTEHNGNKETSRKPAENNRIVKQRPHLPVESITPPKDKKNEQIRKPDASLSKQVAPFKPKLSVADTRAARPARPSIDQRVHTETRLQQKPEKVAIQRPPVTQQNVGLQLHMFFLAMCLKFKLMIIQFDY